MSYKISRSKAGEDSLVLPRDVHSLHFNIMMIGLSIAYEVLGFPSHLIHVLKSGSLGATHPAASTIKQRQRVGCAGNLELGETFTELQRSQKG
ncbi:hypothetical protein FEM48_Zijuj07G0167800 [Ziziphus jujuba var. spinosa]|uniref:Uncharacterized protein n=1 Tax=Ziziphus jujuba var. spinosa TaxID=714518 RepID=A0A978V5T1_ZIZJJ|nr:hypothetical protein FEM48_Zijuj07G0167800 [Ziziphus jujuba var. spinosa]